MAKRPLISPSHPEAFGLMMRSIARYAEDSTNKTTVDAHLERHLGDDARHRARAHSLVSNFNTIPAKIRVKELGDLATPLTTSLSADRLERAFKALPPASVAEVAFSADDVPGSLPPISPLDTITLSFAGLFCGDETDDQGGILGASDEIYVITNTIVQVNGTNVVRTERHPLTKDSFKDIDNGEFRVGPLAACYRAHQRNSHW